MANSSKQFDAYRGVKVVVTGASGFIGRWVARLLCAEQADIHLLVRNRVQAQEVFSDYEIRGEVTQIDLRDAEAVENLFLKIQPSITFNLAGYGVDPTERDDTTANTINAELVRTICRAMNKVRDKNWTGQDFIHAGSALEYGVATGDLDENTDPAPTTLYGMSKLTGTRYLARYSENNALKGLTARLFMVYGPGEHAGRLLPSLMAAAKNDSSLQLTAGRQQRDFTYVEEAAEGLLRLGLTSSGPDKIINLATGKLQSVRSFVEAAANVLQIASERLNFGAIPQRLEEMSHADVAVKRLHKLTGWTPTLSISDGILRTVAFESFVPNKKLVVHH